MILESKIQKQIIDYLKKDNWIVVKTIRLNDSGYPDIFAFRNGKTLFIEVKSEKGVLSELQKHRINKLRQQGFDVLVSNSFELFKTNYKQ